MCNLLLKSHNLFFPFVRLLGMQVGELKGTFGGLKLDVEAMFMQMPSVDLDQLGGQLEAMQHHQAQQVAPKLNTERTFLHSTKATILQACVLPCSTFKRSVQVNTKPAAMYTVVYLRLMQQWQPFVVIEVTIMCVLDSPVQP